MASAENNCLKFIHPFTAPVAGPTGSSKTFWVKKLLTARQFSPVPERFMICYGQFQPMYLELRRAIPNLELHEGLPQNLESEWLTQPARKLIILNDMMAASECNKRVTRLFTQGSHHQNLSVMFLVQNLFFQGTEMRTISLNCHYIVLLKSARDRQQITVLGRQMYPQNTKALQQAYADATKRPFGYLVVNLKSETDEKCRLLTNVFPDEGPAIAYVPHKLT